MNKHEIIARMEVLNKLDMTAEQKGEYKAYENTLNSVNAQEKKDKAIAEMKAQDTQKLQAKVSVINEALAKDDITQAQALEMSQSAKNIDEIKAQIIDLSKSNPLNIEQNQEMQDKNQNFVDELIETHNIENVLRRQGDISFHAMSKVELIQNSMKAGHFTDLLSATINKTLAKDLDMATPAYKLLANKRIVSNLKELSSVRISQDDNFVEVLENGELEEASFTEASNKWKVATYGKEVRLTWQMLVNDEFGEFLRQLGKIKKHSETFKNRLLMQELAKASHYSTATSNLLTNTELNASNLGIALRNLRKQEDTKGNTLSLAPRYLVTNSSNELMARQLITSTAAVDGSNSGVANIFNSLGLSVIIDENIKDSNWLLCADEPATYGILNGAEFISNEIITGSKLKRQIEILLTFGATVDEVRKSVLATKS